MNDYALRESDYGLVTPAGAYMTASGALSGGAAKLMLKLLSQEATPPLQLSQLASWAEMPRDNTLELLHRLQNLSLLSAITAPLRAPQGSPEAVLSQCMRPLSSRGRVLLADSQGLCVYSLGFAHETAEELAGMSAALLALSAHHDLLLNKHLGLQAPHWGLVGPDGCSRLSFWRLQIGEQRLSLVIEGVPHLNQMAFTEVIWCLVKRYLRQ